MRKPIHGDPVSEIRRHPLGVEQPRAPLPNYAAPLFERHELIAMAFIVGIFIGGFVAIYLSTGVL